MIKQYELAFFILFTTIVFSQQKPDYELIEKNIKDENSEYYYTSLLERYRKGDKSMTLKQCEHLYYGFAFQDNFKNFRYKSLTDSIAKYEKNEDKLDSKNILKQLEFRNQILEKSPFDVNHIWGKINNLDLLKRQNEINICFNQLDIMHNVVRNSGDGLTKETAYCINNVQFEWFLINLLDLKATKNPETIDKIYEYILLEKNDKNINGLYFNIEKAQYTIEYQN